MLLEGCTRRPKLPGRPRFRAAAGPPGDFITAPIAGRSLVQLGSSCSTPPRGNVRRHSGFLPLLASGLALGLLQAGGLLAVPEGSAVFPRPLASNAPCGNRWRVGLLSRPEGRSVQRSPWRVGLLFRSEELTVRRSPCRRAFARRRQEAPLGCASRSRAEALLRFADQPLQVSLSPDRLGQVTTSGPEVLRRGLAGGPAGLSFGLLADTKNAHKRSPPKKICFSKSTLYSPRLQTIVDNQNASLTLCFRRRKSTTSLAWDQAVRRGRSAG